MNFAQRHCFEMFLNHSEERGRWDVSSQRQRWPLCKTVGARRSRPERMESLREEVMQKAEKDQGKRQKDQRPRTASVRDHPSSNIEKRFLRNCAAMSMKISPTLQAGVVCSHTRPRRSECLSIRRHTRQTCLCRGVGCKWLRRSG